LTKNGIKLGKFKQKDMYFAGTEATEVVGKLMAPKNYYTNYGKCKYKVLLYHDGLSLSLS
jgi:hypothetical protein